MTREKSNSAIYRCNTRCSPTLKRVSSEVECKKFSLYAMMEYVSLKEVFDIKDLEES